MYRSLPHNYGVMQQKINEQEKCYLLDLKKNSVPKKAFNYENEKSSFTSNSTHQTQYP